MKKYIRIILGMLLAVLLVGCGKLTQTTMQLKIELNKEESNQTETNKKNLTLTQTTQKKPTSKNKINEALQVEFIDVGQGDAILLRTEEQTMLIDCGDNKTEKALLDHLKSKGITKIDYLIGTHPHADHIGGMEKVIDAFEIGKIYMPKVVHTTKTFENVLKSAKAKQYKISTGKAGEKFTLGNNIQVEMLSPTKEHYEDLNNYSIVIKVSNGEDDFLFMGDAEELVEKDLISAKIDLTAEVLKLGHHGSSSSSSDAFIKAVKPKVAIISSGKDNSYGHPHKETIQTLKKYEIIAYDTKNVGTITATSTGEGITFTTEK